MALSTADIKLAISLEATVRRFKGLLFIDTDDRLKLWYYRGFPSTLEAEVRKNTDGLKWLLRARAA